VKFSHPGVSFVGGRVLGKPTTRPTYFPALCTDPGAARGGCHGGECEVEAGNLKSVTRTRRDTKAGLVCVALSHNSHHRYVPPIGLGLATATVRQAHFIASRRS
jgi:hypothetical protein